jgi:hypothetical protein
VVAGAWAEEGWAALQAGGRVASGSVRHCWSPGVPVCRSSHCMVAAAMRLRGGCMPAAWQAMLRSCHLRPVGESYPADIIKWVFRWGLAMLLGQALSVPYRVNTLTHTHIFGCMYRRFLSTDVVGRAKTLMWAQAPKN